MKKMESFLVLYFILKARYFMHKEEDLAVFLSSISPETWADGKPMAADIYEDWKEQTDTEKLTPKNILAAIYSFLEFYEQNSYFKFDQIKYDLLHSVTEEDIQEAMEHTQEMYDRFHYDE